MKELGWLNPGAFREADKQEILEHSIMRYHAYALASSHHATPLIDPLAQLSGSDDHVSRLHARTYAGHRLGVAYAPTHGKSVQRRL